MTPDWAALKAAGDPYRQDLLTALTDPARAQRTTLDAILTETTGTAFARAHALTPETFDRLPVQTYDDLAPWIDRIVAGEADVLTRSPVTAFELTGGSSGGRKPVPLTAPLLAAFQRGLMAWFADLLTHVPAIGRGRAYFALSPALRETRTLGTVPVGLPNDLAYFGDHARHLAPLLLHDDALDTTDPEDWAEATLRLIDTAELSLISVWSPTFLTALLDRRPAPPHWPNLALVSAWADASSASPAADLAARLPQAHFQPKGLLATEAIITIPLMNHPDPVPALTSTYLEFCDGAGALHPVHTLTPGETYDLILTTPGGLIRYDIGDRVTCTGQNPPTLRFAGRARGTDLVGEKLTEDFVARRLPPRSILVARPNPARYVLLTETAADPYALDAALSDNPQYAYARRIGQLPLPRIVPRVNLMADVVRHRLALGHRLSDIKAPVLLDDEKARAIWPDLT